MTPNEDHIIMISNLKGRISKVLSFKNQLLISEKEVLEDIYCAIDTFIISKKKAENIKELRKVLFTDGTLLEGSSKKYIQEHILPLISKLSKDTWRKKEKKEKNE